MAQASNKTRAKAHFDRKSCCAYAARAAIMLVLLVFCQLKNVSAQTCPSNIDFEKGNFDGWKCYTGSVLDQGGVHVFDLAESGGPVPGRHTLISASNAEVDPFGGFSTASPIGNGYNIMLGNNTGGGEGEAVSYEFTIPANANTYSLLYYYAVVFEGPTHEQQQQPRMQIELENVTKGTRIECGSFSFIPFGTTIPGFFQSPVVQSNSPVYCKDWTPVTINLDGNAGSTIRLTFRTGDCTFRRHFGYAYIDIASNCEGGFDGASFCPLDKEVTVKAPFGFRTYEWFNANMSEQLGTGQTITLNPAPTPGTVLNVRLTPYPGYGCPQTLVARLLDNLVVKANAGNDTISCNDDLVRIGGPQQLGLTYQWSPESGLSNPYVSNPFAKPDATTSYVLTTQSPGGGCTDKDTVTIVASELSGTLTLQGKAEYCIGENDSILLWVGAAKQIQWFKDSLPMPGQIQTVLRPDTTGTYYANLRDEYGCVVNTKPQYVNISAKPSAAFSLNSMAQCLIGNRFAMQNTSSTQLGAMQYQWQFGSGGNSSLASPTFSFTQAGQHEIKLLVSTNQNCGDSASATVTVYPNPVPVFEAKTTCINLPFQPVNNTNENIGSPVKYNWYYGDTAVSATKEAPDRIFTQPGTMTIRLAVSSEQCPTPVQTATQTVVIEKPQAGSRYPAKFAIQNAPLPLVARQIGVAVSWLPPLQLDDATSYKPIFTGTKEQDYKIVFTSEGGCITEDFQLVQIVKQANIEVPSGFTPNGDGLNDYLRPIGIGIASIKYFRVFNRFGELLYESRDLQPRGWDGRKNGVAQSSQAVVWMVEAIGLDNSVVIKKGTSVLVR